MKRKKSRKNFLKSRGGAGIQLARQGAQANLHNQQNNNQEGVFGGRYYTIYLNTDLLEDLQRDNLKRLLQMIDNRGHQGFELLPHNDDEYIKLHINHVVTFSNIERIINANIQGEFKFNMNDVELNRTVQQFIDNSSDNIKRYPVLYMYFEGEGDGEPQNDPFANLPQIPINEPFLPIFDDDQFLGLPAVPQ